MGKQHTCAVLLAAAFLAGCALPPKGVSQSDIANFEAALASVDCDLQYESDYLPIELQTGLTRQQVQEIASYEVAAGKAERLPGGGVKLTTGACA